MVTETLINRALGASGVVAWRWDIASGRIDWSAGAEEVVGLPDIVLRSADLFVRAIHPDDFRLVSLAYAHALRTGGPMSSRFRVMAPSGVRWIDSAGRPILDESGNAVAATGTMLDVTEDCEAEEAMLQTLHDTELVLGNIGARVWEWDSETDDLEYLSPPTGPSILAREDAVGLTLSSALGRLNDQEAAMVRDAMRHALATGEAMSFEVTVTDDEGIARRVFVRGGVSPQSPTRLTGVSVVLS